MASRPHSSDELSRLSRLDPLSSDSPFLDFKNMFSSFNNILTPFSPAISLYSLTPSRQISIPGRSCNLIESLSTSLTCCLFSNRGHEMSYIILESKLNMKIMHELPLKLC